jgi:hypothetical protein
MSDFKELIKLYLKNPKDNDIKKCLERSLSIREVVIQEEEINKLKKENKNLRNYIRCWDADLSDEKIDMILNFANGLNSN